jgi:hypothetical protein
MRESPSSRPSEPRAGLDCIFKIMIPVFFLCRILVVVFVSAPASASICSLSLCLSFCHEYLSISLYIYLSSLRVSPRMSLQKNQRQVQS